jgi:hypothetical protein
MKIGIVIASAVFVFVFITVAILYAAGLSEKAIDSPCAVFSAPVTAELCVNPKHPGWIPVYAQRTNAWKRSRMQSREIHEAWNNPADRNQIKLQSPALPA